MLSFWDKVFWGNTVAGWTTALSIMVAALLALKLFERIVLQRLRRLADRTTGTLDDFLVNTFHRSVMPLLYVLAIYGGLVYLHLPARVDNILHIAVLFLNTFFIIRIISSFLGHFVHRFIRNEADGEMKKKQARGILVIIQAAVWVVGLVFLIDNLGYDITTIVAGLGIGGIAIALAAQTVLGDLFSYLVIFFDKPFEIGDFIVVDSKMGVVEYIGIKTTRLRTLSGEQLVCSNTDLTNSRVHNYKRMEKRRVLFSFGVEYSTRAAQLQRIPEIVKDIAEALEDVQFDRCHFLSFGDYSLNFEVVYYVLSAEYNLYMDRQQAINLEIFQRFEAEGIQFAFPTQTLLLHKVAQQPSLS
jgi:small-conductance mechanosensitive channel